MSTMHIRLYEVCRRNLRLQEAEAKETVEVIQDVAKTEQADKHKHLEQIMQKDIKQLDERMTREFANLRSYIDHRFAAADSKFATKEDLARELGSVCSDLSRTIYLASLGQLVAIIASVISIIMILKK